jgi:hypothetical protein
VKKRPAVIAAATALSIMPALGFTYGAQALATPPSAAVRALPMFTPDPNGLLGLVMGCFPSNIQADMQLILDGDVWGGFAALLPDTANLTPAQLQTIMANLQTALGSITATTSASPSASATTTSSTDTASTLVSLLTTGPLTTAKALQVLLTVR